MPEKLLGAFIAIEDRRFNQHWGIDIIRLTGALGRTALQGRRLSGTSTLTQQLARNIYLFKQRSKRNLIRKAREMLLAMKIEKSFSKDEILERYLNYVDLGRYGVKTLHGVQQAAMGYFEKQVWELDYHECALLAALPKGPSEYSPIHNPKNAKERRDLVLDQMLIIGYITESEWLESRKAPLLPQNPRGTKKPRKEAGHFLDYVHQELIRLPILKDTLYSGGLKVYTTIDMSMQTVAEKAVADHLRTMDSTYGNRYHLPNYDKNKHNAHGTNPIDRYLPVSYTTMTLPTHPYL